MVYQHTFTRHKTRTVQVGDKAVGGDNPIWVQSMTTPDTHDIEATVAQIHRLEEAGCEIVRVTVPKPQDAAVLGEMLARNLQVSVGGTVSVLGAARDGSVAADVLKVVGIFRSGIPQLDRSILEMPLSRAQEAFAMTDRSNTIALGGPTLAAVNAALPRLDALGARHGVTLLDWKALEPAMRDAITLKYVMSLLLYLTLVAVVAFIILNALLMSVLERTHEFGVLLAIGMRPRAIGLMVWLELLALALLGCAIGLAVGGAATGWLEQRGISYGSLGGLLAQYGLPPRLYPTLDLVSACTGPLAILGAIVLGGIVPYLRVARLTAVAAMRSA